MGAVGGLAAAVHHFLVLFYETEAIDLLSLRLIAEEVGVADARHADGPLLSSAISLRMADKWRRHPTIAADLENLSTQSVRSSGERNMVGAYDGVFKHDGIERDLRR